jgi:hypothetical protein
MEDHAMTTPTPEGKPTCVDPKGCDAFAEGCDDGCWKRKPTMTVEQAIAWLARMRVVEAWQSEADAVASLLREMQEKIKALTAERDMWHSRCVALFWDGHADNITGEVLRKAAEKIRQHLEREK